MQAAASYPNPSKIESLASHAWTAENRRPLTQSTGGLARSILSIIRVGDGPTSAEIRRQTHLPCAEMLKHLERTGSIIRTNGRWYLDTTPPARTLSRSTPQSRVMRFTVIHKETGERFVWRCWRDGRYPAGWVLRTHDDAHDRELAGNWIDSVPAIRLIADNYGCACEVS